ncbi:hypothetical protein IQ65_06930 [Leptospira interrogans serovar Lai]|nr:hypothetical protein IQ65_06930 [Leptospira interrogans serovar Lai]
MNSVPFIDFRLNSANSQIEDFTHISIFSGSVGTNEREIQSFGINILFQTKFYRSIPKMWNLLSLLKSYS